MTAALAIRDVQVSRGSQEVLRSVSLDVAAGEVCALMGVSGAGKSTVLRAIAALEPLAAGSIVVGGATLERGALPPQARLRALRRQVGLVFQQPSLFEHLTVLENVTLAPIRALGWSRERADDAAHRLLSALGVAHRASAFPRQLSGGEAQRVAIARALALDPALLLMDEPTSALDPARRGALGDALRRLALEGRALLIATHDVDFARSFADRVVVLHRGEIVEEGAAEMVLGSPAHEATRELLRGAAVASPAPRG
jgi:ABC-type polar amino acid transport system ATPase subunit